MSTIIIFINFFIVLILFFAFYNLKLSVSLYFSYLILVPVLELTIFQFTVGYNLLNIVLLISYLLHYYRIKKSPLSFGVVNPFLFLFFALLFLSLFTFNTPFAFQLNNWRVAFMKTCILQFIIWNIYFKEPKILNYIKFSFIISVIITCMYGILLASLNGFNPYTSFLSKYLGFLDAADIYSSFDSRVSFSNAGKIQSTMNHPMTWALFLCFSFIIVIVFYLKNRNKLYLLLLALITYNLIVSGVRTGLAALFIGFIYYFILMRNYKSLIYGFLIFLGLFIVISSNNDLLNIFNSFTDYKGSYSSIQGSTIQLRLNQYAGAIAEIKNSMFFGNGFGWVSYYRSINGDHPVLLSFESLIFVVLCNSGFLGIVIWIIFFGLLFRVQRIFLNNKVDVLFMDTLVIVYCSYAIGTGEYGYLSFFSIFYTFLLILFLDKRFKKTSTVI